MSVALQVVKAYYGTSTNEDCSTRTLINRKKAGTRRVTALSKA